MFLLNHPDTLTVERFLSDCEDDRFSYAELGATRASTRPAGYNIDHNRIRIGNGPADFEKAKSSIRTWKMFDIGWVKLFYPNTPIEPEKTVAIMARHYGFYSLNAARIIYDFDDETKELLRFGFAYGTLTEHGEIGEERFSVEYSQSNGEVWYDLFAFSRPGALLAKVGYPLSRHLQKAFARDSKKAMHRQLAETPSLP